MNCPITMEKMKDPVIMPDGYTYEREAIKRALQIKPESPMTRQKMDMSSAVPNRALKKLIEDSFQKPSKKYHMRTHKSTSSCETSNLKQENEKLARRVYQLESQISQMEVQKVSNSCILSIKLNNFSVVGHETVYGIVRLYTYWELYKGFEKVNISTTNELELNNKDQYSIQLAASYCDFMGDGPRIMAFGSRIYLKNFIIGQKYYNTSHLKKCGQCRSFDSQGLMVNYTLELKQI